MYPKEIMSESTIIIIIPFTEMIINKKQRVMSIFSFLVIYIKNFRLLNSITVDSIENVEIIVELNQLKLADFIKFRNLLHA